MKVLRPNNHPNRTALPYKVHPGTSKPVAAFKHEDDALCFARDESRGCSIIYIVKRNAETVQRYFRGEEVPNG